MEAYIPADALVGLNDQPLAPSESFPSCRNIDGRSANRNVGPATGGQICGRLQGNGERLGGAMAEQCFGGLSRKAVIGTIG